MRYRAVLIGAALLTSHGGCGFSDNDLAKPRPSAEDAGAAPKAAPPSSAAAFATPGQAEPASQAGSTNSPPAVSSEAGKPPRAADLDSLSAEEIAVQPLASKPDEPLSPADRRARSVASLLKISQALEAYLAERDFFPSGSRRGNTPLLSWRVELLPALGYESLYKEFRRSEPWDSPHNKKLIPRIPAEFQSPERFDACTNYLAPAGRMTVLDGIEGVERGGFADGVRDTILVVEANDELATPWTRPNEWSFDETAPRRGLGALREGGFLAALGGGEVVLVPASLSDAEVRALFTIAGGEKIAAASITLDPLAEVPADPPTEDSPAVPQQAPPLAGADAEFSPVNLPSAVTPTDAPSASIRAGRAALPNQIDQEYARQVLSEVFKESYAAARTKEDRLAVAETMMGYVPSAGDDHAARFVLLDAVRKIAAANGEVKLARKACDRLAEEFEGDFTSGTIAAIKTLAGGAEKGERRELAEWAEDLMTAAYDEDRFLQAKEAHGVALSLARNAGDRELVRSLMMRQTEIETARREYSAVAGALDMLDKEPRHASSHLILGRYLCFIKGFWDKGLPYLAAGSDARLAAVAEQEVLIPPSTGQEQIALADAWWGLRDSYDAPFREAIEERAAHWYRLASAQLPDGLLRIKAEARLQEVE
ncbi:MAG: DUF1559 domain-containing protein [Planctomycetes bacterium]|nr:DUF1559 domain-containing protein [Planctomycetota bacterium]